MSSKKSNAPGAVSLGAVASRILDGGGLADAPILSRRKGPEKRIAEAKAEEKEALAVAHAKRALAVTAHEPLNRKAASDAAARSGGEDLSREKMLRKIATQGVVALFNAVRGAQREGEAEAEGAAAGAGARGAKRRRAADDARPASMDSLSKDSFLDILRRGTTAQTAGRASASAAPAPAAPAARGAALASGSSAAFLRDDFMMKKARARDWEREVEEDEEDLDEEAERGAALDDDD